MMIVARTRPEGHDQIFASALRSGPPVILALAQEGPYLQLLRGRHASTFRTVPDTGVANSSHLASVAAADGTAPLRGRPLSPGARPLPAPPPPRKVASTRGPITREGRPAYQSYRVIFVGAPSWAPELSWTVSTP